MYIYSYLLDSSDLCMSLYFQVEILKVADKQDYMEFGIPKSAVSHSFLALS